MAAMVGVSGTASAGGVGAGSDGALRLGLDLNKVDIDGLLACLSHGEAHAARPRPRPQQPAAGALAARRQAPAPGAAPPGAQRPSGSHSRLHGPALAGGRCGERLRFTVTVCDINAEVCRSSAATVTALVEGLSLMSKTHPEPRPRVESNDDGTYSVQFVCATPGSYNVTVSVDGVVMPMCPLQIDVGPGPASAHKSEVQGKDNQVVDLGGMGKFTVVAHDEFGNLCHEGGSRLGVRALGHVKLLEVTDNEDGTYQVVYSVPEWAQGPVKIEVLLDGVRLRDSPVVPQVRRQLQRDAPEQQAASGKRPGEGSSLQDQIENLRWLRENPPVEVPVLPPVSLLEGAAASIPQALGGAASGPAAAAAWRAADEWRQLSEARAEIARAREELRRHQDVLLSVGNAVHGEVIRIQDRDRDVSAKMRQLEQAEEELQSMRAELGRQYLQQQATASSPAGYAGYAGYASFENSTTARELAREKLGIRTHGREQPPRPGAARAAAADPRGWAALDAVGGEGSLMADEMSQLLALREGLEGKRRYLQQLEHADQMLSGPPHAPTARGGLLAGEPAEASAPLPGPPRVTALPPPELEDWAGSPLGAGTAASSYSYGTPAAERSPGGLLSSPPSSPTPPPEWPPGSPSSGGDADIGRVMKHIFRSYASKSGGSAALPPKGARSGRVALCKQDLVRLAQAAQLRIPGSELEEAFDGTARRFGALNLGKPDSAEPALPFELFVELVTETARRQYSDLPEGDATRLLFEKHFVPLSRRLSQLEG